MAVTADIARTYRAPRAVLRRLLDQGPREDRALGMAMLSCVLIFLAQWPRLSREAHLTGQELDMLIGGALFGWVFVAPLLLYGIAALSHLVARGFGGHGSWFAARLALFWALLSAVPLWLVHGLVAGFVGPGPLLTVVGALALGAFLWFWVAGLCEAEGECA
ncbi:YIP1 family protein [Roseitranquillus sediminis]|uniref:YIP1 family protein n=1 Tax=Roseitranquillus sediminis TaxID=2809051 RepID=UPI001D0C0E7C|nr:YIP1 family protein [Roseitranquillus sediminis]MBM9595834.1 YIP1 family protein [Roseitranquillus sediminis]